MTELIRQNAEQMRRNALQNSKDKQNNIKSVQSKIHNSNPFQNEFYNIRNIKNSKSHKLTEQYLDHEVATKEFEDMCEHYRLYRIRNQILEKQQLMLNRDHDAFTIRNTAQLVNMIAEELLIKHDVKIK